MWYNIYCSGNLIHPADFLFLRDPQRFNGCCLNNNTANLRGSPFLKVDMNYKAGVYVISNLVNGKHYVGSATDIERRWGEHRRMFRRNNHENQHLQRSWNKYGKDAFLWRVLLYCDGDNIKLFEQRAIDTYKAFYGWRMLYNYNPSASSSLGRVPSEESRAKMKARTDRPFQGQKHTDETKAIISSKAKQRWTRPEFRAKYLGRPMSEETKAKIRAKKVGKFVSEETRQKLSIAGKGRPMSEKVRQKLANSPRFRGRHHTEEAKQKISQIHKGRVHTEEHRKNNSLALKGRVFSEEHRKNLSEAQKKAAARRRRQAQESSE